VIRDSIGEEVVLMADYNQSLSVAEASRRAAALEGEGLYWIEEPTRADHYSGHAQIRRDTNTPSRSERTGGDRTRLPRAWRRVLPTT
jgi:mandelate racemase